MEDFIRLEDTLTSGCLRGTHRGDAAVSESGAPSCAS